MKKWSEVISNPEYQALSPVEQSQVKGYYFDDVVAPNIVESDIQGAREDFFSYTTSLETPPPEKPTIMGDIVKPALKDLESGVRGAGAILGGMVAFPVSGVAGYAKLVTSGPKAALKTIEDIQAFPQKLLKTEQQKETVSNIMKPIEMVDTAATFYADKAVELSGSPEVGATVKTAFEALVWLGIPALKAKLIKNIKAGKIEAMKNTLVEIENAKLEKLKAEPKRLGKLVEAEKALKDTAIREGKIAEQKNVILTRMDRERAGTKQRPLETLVKREKTISAEVKEAPYKKLFDEAELKAESKNNILTRMDREKAKAPGRPLATLKAKEISVKADVALKKKETLYKKLFDEAENQIAIKEKGKGTTLYSGLPVKEMGKTVKKLYDKTYGRVGSLIWDKGVEKMVPKLLEKVPGGALINKAFIREYRKGMRGSEKYVASLDEKNRRIGIAQEAAVELGNKLQSFNETRQIAISEYLKGGRPRLSENELKYAKQARDSFLELGRQAVELGILSKKTFFKNAGRYMPRLYTKHEFKGLLNKYGFEQPSKLDLTRFKKRKNIPIAIRKQMGEILTPGYPVAKGLSQLHHTIETAKFFDGISRNPDWARLPISEKAVKYKSGRMKIQRDYGDIPDDFKLIEGKQYGRLDGSYVHPEIYSELKEMGEIMKAPERVWRKTLGYWKFGKVILSPKTHVRNMISNSVLAHMGGLPMYEQPYYLAIAAKELKTGGKFYMAAKKEGLFRSTFTNAELRTLFDQAESQMSGIKAASIQEKLGIIGQGLSKVKQAGRSAAKLYEAEEQWFKMAKYIHNVKRGKMSSKAAMLDAEKWLFNYQKLTRFQEKYRTKWYGAPFATFTFKAIPRIAETAIKTPHRLLLPGYIIYKLEQVAQEKIGDTIEQIKAKKALRPDYMQGNMFGIPNFARWPVFDQYGRERYLNLTYILPWGDLAEQGGFGPIPSGLTPFSQPFLKEPIQLMMNYDSFWKDKIVKDRDIAGKTGNDLRLVYAKKMGEHALKSFGPTLLTDFSKIMDTIRKRPDYKGRLRDKATVALDVLMGIKLYPVDYAEQVQRKIAKVHPQNGSKAREIRGQIKKLYLQRESSKKAGGNPEYYDKKIAEYIDQLNGLAKETMEISENYQKIK